MSDMYTITEITLDIKWKNPQLIDESPLSS